MSDRLVVNLHADPRWNLFVREMSLACDQLRQASANPVDPRISRVR